MVFLGVVLAIAAVVAGIEVITQNSSSASLDFFGHNVPGVHTEARVFIVGMAVAAVIAAGLAMSSVSLVRKMRSRRELLDLREEREESMEALKTQNRQLRRELAHARSGGAPRTAEVPVSPGPRVAREPASPFFDNRA
jgi:hypothetical protein